jgi:hypothetical protein
MRQTGSLARVLAMSVAFVGLAAIPAAANHRPLSVSGAGLAWSQPPDADPVGGRSVPILTAGARSNGAPVTVTIPSTTPPGNYVLGACADDGDIVVESNEINNCRVTPIQIQ